MKTTLAITAASLLAPLALACTADDPVERNQMPDAGVVEALEAPTFEVVPTATPNSTVALRGRADGQRVVVSGGPDITATTGVLPSGNFCHDATLEPEGITELTVYTIDGTGGVSEPFVIEVERDPAAAMPSQPTCAGTIGDDECLLEESCGSNGDENCNGLADGCDPACNGCQDDIYEPNDRPKDVPALPGRGNYDLQLCPCRPDWFAFTVQQGERIRVGAEFDGGAMNLNMKLYPAQLAQQGGYVASSLSAGDSEEIDYIAEASGTYYLETYVFDLDGEGEGSYTLIVY